MAIDTSTATDVVERARALQPLISAVADDIERERRLPEQLLAPMHEAGMFRMFLPAEAGGLELDPWTGFEVAEALSMADGSAGWLAMITSLSAWTAAFSPREVAREIFGDPRGLLAESFVGEHESRLADGGIVITGRFHFASGCLHSTWIGGVVADPRHEGEQPRSRLMAVMPAEQCRIIDVWNTTGLRGTSSNDWDVDAVFVPWERTFRFPVSRKASFANGPLYTDGRLSVPGVSQLGVALGIARGAIDGYLERVEQRVRRGQPMKQEEPVQYAIGRADALVSAARAYLKDASDNIWATLCAGEEPSLAQYGRLRSAKTMAMTNALEAVDLVYEAMGGQAIMGGNPVERRFRDIHTAAAHYQSSRQGFTVAGAVLLGLDPRPHPLLS